MMTTMTKQTNEQTENSHFLLYSIYSQPLHLFFQYPKQLQIQVQTIIYVCIVDFHFFDVAKRLKSGMSKLFAQDIATKKATKNKILTKKRRKIFAHANKADVEMHIDTLKSIVLIDCDERALCK